jgi:predicted hydrocarbon binding protein
VSNQTDREKAVAAGASFEYPLPIFVYECAVNVFRAMLEEVGLNRVIEASKRYNEAWGRAVVGMVKERFGQQPSDLETIAMTEYYVHCCTSIGHMKPLEIREGGAITELYACPNPGMRAPPEMCIAMSHVMAEAYCQAVNPHYEFAFTHHLARGDDCCRWVVMKKASKFNLDDLGKLRKTVPLELSMEEMWSFASRMVVFSQLFTFTSASIDLIGSQRTSELVAPLARVTGLRLGTKLKGGAGQKGDLFVLKDKLDIIGSILQQNGNPAAVTDFGIEREITDCPCKGGAPEVCKQFEGVFNGVCEAINPEYEFAYDRMMSKGDVTCHWVVKKRSVLPQFMQTQSGEMTPPQ